MKKRDRLPCDRCPKKGTKLCSPNCSEIKKFLGGTVYAVSRGADYIEKKASPGYMEEEDENNDRETEDLAELGIFPTDVTPLSNAQIPGITRSEFRNWLRNNLDRAIAFKTDPCRKYFKSFLKCKKIREIARKSGWNKDSLQGKFSKIVQKLIDVMAEQKKFPLDGVNSPVIITPKRFKDKFPLENF